MKRRIFFAFLSPILLATAVCGASVIDDARKLVKDGKYDEAIRALEGELKKKPKDAMLKKELAEAHTAYGEF